MLGLVTADVAAPLDPDLSPFDAACRARLGDDAVRIVSWDDPEVEWSAFDAVVIRSTWDYTERLDEFLDWVDRVSNVTELINGAAAVRWSTDKRYLAELATEGIPIVPTTFVAPGEPAPVVDRLHVVKPTVGAGSSGARRCEPDEVAAHVAELHAQGRTAMVQPYLDRLDELGESAFCFVPAADGDSLELSHVFRKGAILTTTDVEQEGDLFAKEDITVREPDERERALVDAVLATRAVQQFDRIAFARVDVAPASDPTADEPFVVMELELIEPSFYLGLNVGSADLFADRLVAWMRRHRIGVAS
jgi:hypothetical protein